MTDQSTNPHNSQPRVPWTTTQRRTAIQMWADGETVADIAEAVGRSHKSVRGYASDNRHLFPFRRNPQAANAVRFTVSLSPSMHEKLSSLAESKGCSRRYAAAKLIEQGIQSREARS